MTNDPFLVLFLLCAFHFVCDYGLQSEYVALNKAPNSGNKDWWLILGAHSMIHAAPVALLTGIWQLGLAEAMLHFFIDRHKSLNRFSHATDQLLHLACKGLWWLFWLLVATPFCYAFKGL
jgi:hypothetical protein